MTFENNCLSCKHDFDKEIDRRGIEASGACLPVGRELVGLEERINDKIRKITVTYQKLPYDRLRKGRRLKECCLGAITYLDEGNELKLQEAIRELLDAGIKLNSWKPINLQSS